MGASLGTIVFMGLTIGELIIIGIAALAICFIIDKDAASEGMKKVFDGVSSLVSGVVGGVTGVISNGAESIISNLKIPSLLLLLGGGYLGYKLFIEEDSDNRIVIENDQQRSKNDY